MSLGHIFKKLNVTVEDSTDDEILNATKEMIDHKVLDKNILKNYFKDNNISFNHIEYSVKKYFNKFINNNNFYVKTIKILFYINGIKRN